MFTFSQETPADLDEVEWLYDLAFAPGRRALSSYQLRRNVLPVPELCQVAHDELGVVGGAIRYWPVQIGDAKSPALLLGPVAVHPTRQGEGLGALLMFRTLELAADLGWLRVILVGDEPYYRRFGFDRATAASIRFPPPTNPDRLLARALEPNAFDQVSGLVEAWR